MIKTGYIRCLIVEDEVLPAELLSGYIHQTPSLELVGLCQDAVFALEWLQTNPVDLMFLDIHLPQLKGLEMLQLLKHPPLVILTTAYHDYALEGYRHDVVDYLLKPISFGRFLEAVERVKRRIPTTTESEYIFFKVNKQQIKVPLSEVIFVESMKEYSKIHLKDRFWVTQMTLLEMEERLPSKNFVRIHRSYIINKEKITAFSATEIKLEAISLPIGKTYRGVL
jgi:DNA-binding LytR/AlgR family response regulator